MKRRLSYHGFRLVILLKCLCSLCLLYFSFVLCVSLTYFPVDLSPADFSDFSGKIFEFCISPFISIYRGGAVKDLKITEVENYKIEKS